ncbi:hypothetical protein Ancab_014952 [Ancistrocladus abbreviatus]
MRRNRGFKLGRRIVRIFKWVIHRSPKPTKYRRLRLEPPTTDNNKNKAISKLCKWGRSLRRGAKELCFFKSGRGYIPVGHEPDETKRAPVPKGHLAIYVGEKEDDTHRVLVPVIYLNHPLFGQLLKEAEEAFGFDHPGQITLPCPISQFQTVQTKIAASEKSRPCRQFRAVECRRL